MQQIRDFVTGKDAMNIVKSGDQLFASLPHLPDGVVEFLVKVAPYLALLGAILTIVFGPIMGIVGTLGSLALLSPGLAIFTIVSLIIAVLSALMLLLAFKPLQDRDMYGWLLVFWVQILSLITSLFAVVINGGAGVIYNIIGTFISFYILYEMKRKYA